MLSRYFCWASENHRLESLETLRDWITEELEYQVKAMESIEGLGAKAKGKEDRRKNLTFTTFRGRRKEVFAFQRKCYLCQGNHGIWSCQQLEDANVDERWRITKDKRLCFRCLCNSHQGKDCVRAGECGENGCRRSHHRSLHPSEECGNREVSYKAESVSNPSSPSSRTLTTVTSDVTEGNTEQATDEHPHITTLTSAEYQEFVSLRAVPVWLSAKGKKIKVNAVLDDASTVSYGNEEVAGALSLSATYEKVTVNVLNENVETCDSVPVSLTLESCDGNVKGPFIFYGVEGLVGFYG